MSIPTPPDSKRPVPLDKIHVVLGLDQPISTRRIRHWREHGLNGVKLETFHIGRHVYTNQELVERFVRDSNR
jgi:surfactin synthase thioesterase subunit